ncbi:uncharacterized protein YpuA (DUF1002 family) [Salsuginibacillus halophilus]|uniref:Uncharacterized protein YpuA (DUF1002 family) n=1 Tax=Salsuginibacillus halophilus TaxID=517424 RepID=A0A2P8H7V4_9BACI|nr:DUF1002 domain-containing protein [Salsuginibacillus halophilus]PSL42306.1 uncharacterized protein YpuA (DUF1002 family) [Salsuginibacillus halophilus]
MAKQMGKSLLALLIILPAIFGGQPAGAADPGDEIFTLGEDLSPEQREAMLNEMGGTEESTIVEVTNEEEHDYLGAFIDASVIGSNALSSSRITIGEEGDGIDIESNNIDWVSDKMYANALITAGVKDAHIYVTAPFELSGTGALTGLLKAYETETDIEIPEENKRIANEEMVRTGELADNENIEEEEASELMARIKEELADRDIQSEADLRELIEDVADELGITLSEEEIEGLVSLFDRMRDLNIDWDQVQDQIGEVRSNVEDWLQSDEAQSFFDQVADFFEELVETIRGWVTQEN